jgi:ubiquinone/menaquinone biosynthesis C-methylase UbiE
MSDALDIYLRVREKEGRLYPDEIVGQLPAVPANHPLHAEWQARAASCARLTTYLSHFPGGITVLELGCGNGWLAHRIAAATNAPVIGLDLNCHEIRQAHRLFAHSRNLSWIVTDIARAPFNGRVFDIIVIASAIQYFAELSRLFRALILYLKEDGEIHILDSPFYSDEQLPEARERSRQYYAGLGFPEMASHYHHHSTDALAEYNPDWLYVPSRGKVLTTATKDSPFPWVRLRPREPW